MSTKECIFCAPTTNNEIPLTQIVESFKTALRLLEHQAKQVDADHHRKVENLELQLQNLRIKNSVLEEEKKTAQDRSDTYKKRFIDAQEAIKTLHEKNLSLSRSSNRSRLSQNTTTRSFPFSTSVTEKVLSPGTKKLILAPDTCIVGGDPHNGDVTYISSDDDDDFRAATKTATNKSPRPGHSASPRVKLVNDGFFTKQKTPSPLNSFFAKPKSPVRLSKQKEAKSGTRTPEIDMDETRMDVCEQMDMSVRLAHAEPTTPSQVTVMSTSALLDAAEDWDSIPASPVLSVGRERRLGVHSSRGSIPKYNIHEGEKNETMESPSLLPTNLPFSNRLSGKLPLLMSSSLDAEPMKESTDSDVWHGNPLQDSLPLHRLRAQKSFETKTPDKSIPGNTSLDDLFDKTDGDLETTTMLHDTTWDGLHESDAEDEELDILLLQGVNDLEGSFEGKHRKATADSDIENRRPMELEKPAVTRRCVSATTRRPNFHDSFDVVPNKSKDKINYKYQEVVRKHDERRKLDGKACAQCEAYYSDLPEEERRAALKEVCRHKHVNAPPSTPDHFWEVDIPNTEECKRRGYIVDHADLSTQAKQEQMPRLRRKKPLEYPKVKRR